MIAAEVQHICDVKGDNQADRAEYGLAPFMFFAKRLKPNTISEKTLEEYQQWRIKTSDTATSTIRRELGYIVGMLKRNGILVALPPSPRSKKSEVRGFTDDELKRFFANVRSERQKILFKLLLATGARPSELISSPRSTHIPLLKTEVLPNTDEVIIRCCKLKPGEKDRVRRVKIDPELMKDLVRYASGVEDDTVFGSIARIGLQFDRVLERAGIEKKDALGARLVTHSFRHTYATKMADMVGQNTFHLQAALGHAQISTTQRYTHTAMPENYLEIGELG